MKHVATFAAILFLSSVSGAYSNFIGYGYSSCITCHDNPFGNGPLNDYGRALWATEIAGRVFHTSAADDETIAHQSGFLGTTELPQWLRPHVNYRGLWLTNSLGTSRQQQQYIHMQADVGASIHLDHQDRFLIVGSIGYLPTSDTSSSSGPLTKDNIISREYYARVELSKTMHVMAGLMDKVYGLRIPDHIAYSRAQTGLAQNDQAHGVALHFANDDWEGGIEGFVGNLLQDQSLRQQGVSGLVEREVAEKVRIGASALASKNDFIQYNMGALHGRFGFAKGSSVISEVGLINQKPNVAGSTTGAYMFTQGLFRLFKGFNSIDTVEYYTGDTQNPQPHFFRLTPGIQYFPAQRFEFRIEAMNTRTVDSGHEISSVWDLLAQLHLYF